MSTSEYQDASFMSGARKLSAKRWNEGGEPTIALHGYLDNANSFNYLAPRLRELDIIALDFAGHGHSDHRPQDVAYRAELDIEDALVVAEQAGWSAFNLIGHSMGAEIGSQLTGLFPDKVKKLVCIDGIANGGDAQKVIASRSKRMLANVKTSAASVPASSLRAYASLEEMAERVSASNGQQVGSALELIKRGHREVEGGFTWVTDPKLRQEAWEMPGLAELDEMIKRTTAPTLVITASGGQEWFRASLERVRGIHPALTEVNIEGSHHLHMEEPSAQEVVAQIRNFLGLNAH